MERVLITVMTYPHPSTKYDEVVCTAGISAQGEWVRLYPVDRLNQPWCQQHPCLVRPVYGVGR